MAVSLRDVAKAAGVGTCTASKALRGLPGVADATRTRVCDVAERLGYRPNPMMAAAAAKRFEGVGAVREVIAFINEAGKAKAAQALVQSGHRTADRLGYHLEERLVDANTDFRAMERELQARGVRGVILGRFGGDRIPFELNWHEYAAICTTHHGLDVNCHRIRPANFDMLRRLVRQLTEHGFRRIALLLTPVQPRDAHTEYLGAFEAMRLEPDLRDCLLPPLLLRNAPHDIGVEWLREQRPDFVIGPNAHVYWRLRDEGFAIPEDFGYWMLFHGCPPDPKWEAGVSHFSCTLEEMGRRAMMLIDQLLRYNEIGVPQNPMDILIEPSLVWTESSGTR